jgi:hypothetical protein
MIKLDFQGGESNNHDQIELPLDFQGNQQKQGLTLDYSRVLYKTPF